MKKYVQMGNFEFVGGGIVQNDESITQYSSIIHQVITILSF